MNIDNLESAITKIESVLENKDKHIGWQKKEIEGLKGLIRLAFDSGYTAGYIDHSTGKSKIEKSWQEFKNENNL